MTADDGRTYPLPRADDDPRFNAGLLADVARVLEAHGYPEVRAGPDLTKLRSALFGFLYEGHVQGRRP